MERDDRPNGSPLSDSQYRRFSSCSYDWELWVALDGEILYCSPSAERITGYTAEEFVSNPDLVVEIVHPDDREDFVAWHESVLGSKEIGPEYEYRITGRDGEVRWISRCGMPVVTEEGQLLGRHISHRDSTSHRETEAKLREARDYLENLIGYANAPIIVWDAQLCIVRFNAAFERLTGRPAADVVGKPIDLLFPESEREDALEHIRGASAGERWETIEIPIQHMDGPVRTVLWNSATISAPDGSIEATIAQGQDISERKMVEEDRARLLRQVQEERERLFSVLSMFPAYLVLLNTQHEAVFCNQRFTELFGEGQPGQKCYNLIFGRNEPCEDCLSFDCLETGEPMIWEWTDPNDRIFEVYDCPFDDTDGQRLVLEVGFEITERKEAAEELRRHRDALEELVADRSAELAASERKYRGLIENTHSAIIHWLPNGTVEFVNEAAERLLGYEPGELLHRDVRVIVAPEVRPGPDDTDLITAVAREPQRFDAYENEVVTKQGERLFMAWSNRALLDEQGNLTGIMSVGIDRTRQRRAEEELQRHQQRARLLATELALTEQRERQAIATWLHDDIAQVLALVRMRLGFVTVTSDAEEQRRAISEIDGLLAGAIQSTRDVNLELSPPILFEQGLPEALSWAASRARDHYGFEASTAVEGEPRTLDRDTEMIIFQAIKELLNNVGKYADADHVTVTLRYDEDTVVVAVADDGRGFDPDAGRASGGGFGLLNIRERAEYLGGRLVIESRLGEGSRLAVHIPESRRGLG